ncbi:hypothetical protein BKA08_000849 [Nocardioides marinisabuli]|uniref:Uncharacterized protein n=1 Tax=Nocardioides marinisabuli TaxID=419476 RepID=A0A7Y9EZI3_9ACTN|nr:hypothetical protein [Nocardioides marinisabuli]NYD56611.1 hypothetical protein [Nocardioides marinisabuli]
MVMVESYPSEFFFSVIGSIACFGAAGLSWWQHQWFLRGFGKAGVDDFRSRREALWRARLGFTSLPATFTMVCMACALGSIALAMALEIRALLVPMVLSLLLSGGTTVWAWKEFDRPSPRRRWPEFALSLQSELRG